MTAKSRALELRIYIYNFMTTNVTKVQQVDEAKTSGSLFLGTRVVQVLQSSDKIMRMLEV